MRGAGLFSQVTNDRRKESGLDYKADNHLRLEDACIVFQFAISTHKINISVPSVVYRVKKMLPRFPDEEI